MENERKLKTPVMVAIIGLIGTIISIISNIPDLANETTQMSIIKVCIYIFQEMYIVGLMIYFINVITKKETAIKSISKSIKNFIVDSLAVLAIINIVSFGINVYEWVQKTQDYNAKLEIYENYVEQQSNIRTRKKSTVNLDTIKDDLDARRMDNYRFAVDSVLKVVAVEFYILMLRNYLMCIFIKENKTNKTHYLVASLSYILATVIEVSLISPIDLYLVPKIFLGIGSAALLIPFFYDYHEYFPKVGEIKEEKKTIDLDSLATKSRPDGNNDEPLTIIITGREFKFIPRDRSIFVGLKSILPLESDFFRYGNSQYYSYLPAGFDILGGETTSYEYKGEVVYIEQTNTLTIMFNDKDVTPNYVKVIGKISDDAVEQLRKSGESVHIRIEK